MNEAELDDLAVAMLERQPLPKFPRPPGDDLELLKLFLRDNDIRKGSVMAVETCSLYRMYLAWHEVRLDDPVRIRPFSFSVQMKRARFQKKDRTKNREKYTRYLMNEDSAKRCSAWLLANPDTVSFRQWFHTQFFSSKGRHAATAPGEAAREASPDLPPDDHHEGP